MLRQIGIGCTDYNNFSVIENPEEYEEHFYKNVYVNFTQGHGFLCGQKVSLEKLKTIATRIKEAKE